jgi:hypothetical protein
MRHTSRPARDRSFVTPKLFVGLFALLAVIAGLMSMHALDTTVGHSGQPTAVITEMLVDGAEHVDAIGGAATTATAAIASDDAITVAGLLGCAAAGMVCALGVIALVKRAMTGRLAPSGAVVTASPRVAPVTATQVIPRATPSLFALTVLRT